MILTSVEALQQRSISGNLMGPIGGFQGVTESVVDNDAFERHVLPEIAGVASGRDVDYPQPR